MTQRIDIWVESAGLGHVTRQINLLEHLRAVPAVTNIRARFVVDEKAATRQTLERAGHELVVRDADVSKAFRELAAEWSASAPALFILDSVAHDKEADSEVVLGHRGVPSVVFIDDTADRDVSCDLLVNALPSLSTPVEKIKAKRAVRGPEYLVLPAEYMTARLASSRRNFSECRKGFAFFGGADLENFSAAFVGAVSQLPSGISWTLLIGPSYAHTDALLQAVSASGRSIEVVRYVPSMAAELASVDIAVLAAGNTLSEAAAVGTPAIVLSQNPVQAENAHFFVDRAGVLDCGALASDSALRLAEDISTLAGDAHRRRSMSERMMATVDAEGGGRVAALIESLVRAGR